jgi:hypothetical protein
MWATPTTRVEEGLGFEPRVTVLLHLPLSIRDSIHDLGLSPPLPDQGARDIRKQC